MAMLIEGEGAPQGKGPEKVIDGVFMGVSEDLEGYRGPYSSEVERSSAGEG